MGIFDYVRTTFNSGNEEDDYKKDYDDEIEEEAAPGAAVRESSSVVSPANLEMKVCKPSRYDEVAGIATHLLQHAFDDVFAVDAVVVCHVLDQTSE